MIAYLSNTSMVVKVRNKIKENGILCKYFRNWIGKKLGCLMLITVQSNTSADRYDIYWELFYNRYCIKTSGTILVTSSQEYNKLSRK